MPLNEWMVNSSKISWLQLFQTNDAAGPLNNLSFMEWNTQLNEDCRPLAGEDKGISLSALHSLKAESQTQECALRVWTPVSLFQLTNFKIGYRETVQGGPLEASEPDYIWPTLYEMQIATCADQPNVCAAPVIRISVWSPKEPSQRGWAVRRGKKKRIREECTTSRLNIN